MYDQHVVNMVEVKMLGISRTNVQSKPSSQSKINLVTKHVEIPQVQYADKVVVEVVKILLQDMV